MKYEKAVEFGEKAKDWETVASAYHNWGTYLGYLKKFDKACQKYEKAVEFGEKAEEWSIVAKAYYNWGTYLRNQKKFNMAFEKYKKALELRQYLPNSGARIFPFIAQLKIKLNDFKDAAAYFKTGILTFAEIGNIENALQTALTGFEIREKLIDEIVLYCGLFSFLKLSQMAEVPENEESKGIANKKAEEIFNILEKITREKELKIPDDSPVFLFVRMVVKNKKRENVNTELENLKTIAKDRKDIRLLLDVFSQSE